MIFAGDFAQLPPVMGDESAALYSPPTSMFATSKKGQDGALGKAIWHQVTTVVILHENMWQKSQTEEDRKLRTALSHMRYKAFCASSSSSPDINSREFRNVSIITGLNVQKDEINRIGTIWFAQETNQELVHFFSEDFILEKVTLAQVKHGKSSKVTALSPQVQIELWNSPPSTTNKHIPGKLSLCKGLPIMIRSNTATELGITKGQEAFVYSWVEGIGTRGQKVLQTLFVKLPAPPEPIHIPGLPENVASLTKTSVAITCMLKDDSKLNINRLQVEVILNFAMTDYCSQGKTRPWNVVELNNCRSHQSYYTALSRSAFSHGTLILPDYTNHNVQAFDPRKIQGMCSSHLHQEF
ncbi:hypothetical protein IW262DRAFT_1449893 [Armillaria fumosa]|nr:hypothetical protein IW262DRAFT_1449893 [Armillaria fumosa]